MQAGEKRLDEMPAARLLCGDCLEIMRTLPAASIDAMIADPPAGISFMAKSWDSDKGGRDAWIAWLADVMRAALRVLKPGAHALVWSLPRTSHWTATALEDAGFEIRDSIEHVFGSGFPKSLDVSKAIDKMYGAEREVIDVIKKTSYTTPGTLEGWKRPSHKTDAPIEERNIMAITAPATLEAQRYAGFGTALKPAHETWWLVRTPLAESTVAANVLRYGVGALNIDAARVEGEAWGTRPPRTPNDIYGNGKGTNLSESSAHHSGRWPSNFILSHTLFCTNEQCVDGCPVRELDMQSGTLKSGEKHNKIGATVANGIIYRRNTRAKETFYLASEGGASRYFATFHYCPKASRRDRTADGTVENKHPTAKNTALLAYFVRLITPPGGLVLDPFAGSGSTGVAALQEGMRFLGIEESVEYCYIARARLAHAQR